jgi:putative OPT family oligopeptide transporter
MGLQQPKSLAELTIKAVVLGIVLAMILGAANAYLGLFAGMTVSASIPASVVSMGILRFFKKSNILENNIVQTAASAGESVAAGVIFTLPALVILGFWDDFGGKNFWWITIIAAFGGCLGVLFTIPLRRSLIVEAKLQFPEGIAIAEVLQTGERGGKGVWTIGMAAIAGALFKVGARGIGLWPDAIEGAGRIKRGLLYGGSNLSPALLSVGYIVGINIAILIFLGGAANWYIAVPICAALSDGAQYADNVQFAHAMWSTQTRYIGVGAMLVGGFWTIIKMRRSLLSGITSGLRAYRTLSDGAVIERTERDMPMKYVLWLIVASVVPLFVVYQVFVRDMSITLPMAVVMLVAGFVFSAVAAYMAGLVGSSNNPISGVTIATVVVSSLLLVVLMGKDAPNGPAAAIIIGSVVCCAAAISGDNMQDLKCGYLIGATPWKLQVMEMVGTLSGAVVIAPTLMLLHQAYGFKGQEGAGPDALAAVQANLMASVAKGVFRGDMPWNFAFIGMGVAAAIIALDLVLEAKKSRFRTPVLAVAIGFYLPLELSVPIFFGGVIHWAVNAFRRARGASGDQVEGSSPSGLLFASGLITGEALMGIILAIPIVILKQHDINLPYLAFGDVIWGKLLGTILLIAVALWLLFVAMERRKDANRPMVRNNGK